MKKNERNEKGWGAKRNNYKKGIVIEMERTKGRLVGETKAQQQEFEFVFNLMRWDWVETWNNWNKEKRCCHYEIIIKILFWFWAFSLFFLMNGQLYVCARTKICSVLICGVLFFHLLTTIFILFSEYFILFF